MATSYRPLAVSLGDMSVLANTTYNVGYTFFLFAVDSQLSAAGKRFQPGSSAARLTSAHFG